MAKIRQAAVSLSNGEIADPFGQAVSDTMALADTPAHAVVIQNDGTYDLYVGGGEPSTGLDANTGQILVPGASFPRTELPGGTRLAVKAGSNGGHIRALVFIK